MPSQEIVAKNAESSDDYVGSTIFERLRRTLQSRAISAAEEDDDVDDHDNADVDDAELGF